MTGAKTRIVVGGFQTAGDQERIKQELRNSLGLTFGNLDINWTGQPGPGGRPTVMVYYESENTAKVVVWALKNTLGAFSTITTHPMAAAAS